MDRLTNARDNAKEAIRRLNFIFGPSNKTKSILSYIYENLASARISIQILSCFERLECAIREIEELLIQNAASLKGENVDPKLKKCALEEINEKIDNLTVLNENGSPKCMEILEDLTDDFKKIQTVLERMEINMPSHLDINALTGDSYLSYPKLELPDREQLYELFPPQTIKPQPRISVFHAFEVEDVVYRQEDPLGILVPNSTIPTPLPLKAIGVTL